MITVELVFSFHIYMIPIAGFATLFPTEPLATHGQDDESG